MVAWEPPVSRLPAARGRWRRLRVVRPHPLGPPRPAPGRLFGLYRVREFLADATDVVPELRSVRVRPVARDLVVHADRKGSADPVHPPSAVLEGRVRGQPPPV